jgi:type III secretion system FlhB-like substrate exporter
MTKLTEKQTAAVVAYLRRVQQANVALSGRGSLADIIADALEDGLSIEEITATLASGAALNIALGHVVEAGIESGYIAGLNMVKAAVTAEPVDQEPFYNIPLD